MIRMNPANRKNRNIFTILAPLASSRRKKKIMFVRIIKASIQFQRSAKNFSGPMPMTRIMISVRKSQMKMLSKM